MNKHLMAAWLRIMCCAVLASGLAACGGGGGTKNSAGTTGSANGTGSTATLATPVAVQYIASEPAVIYAAGAPGTTRSNVSFRLVDALNQPVSGRNVLLQLVDVSSGASLQNAALDGTLLLVSDADGRVTAGVLAGTVPGAIRTRATVVDFPMVVATSQELTVAVGRAAQRGISLGVESLNIEGDLLDGSETALTVALADRNGNPVPDGTQVNFVASSGVVVPASCVTRESSSRCSVRLRTQGTRTASGRVAILAYSPGEEDFVDLNGNNRWDTGEPFTDMGQAFRDDNENGAYDTGEFLVPRTGSSACSAGAPGRPGTCDGVWGEVDLRVQAYVVFASSGATIGELEGAGANRRIRIADTKGNAMPRGSQISATVRVVPGSNSACQAEISPTVMPNQLLPLSLTVRLTDCLAGDDLQIVVKAPSGVETTRNYTLN